MPLSRPTEVAPPSYESHRPSLRSAASSASSSSVSLASSSRAPAVSSQHDTISLVHPLSAPSTGQWLPHLVDSLNRVSLSKASARLVLSEDVVFIRPPPEPSFDPVDDPGISGRVHGFLNVVSTSRRQATVSVRLTGKQRLVFSDERGGPEEDIVFFREVSVPGPTIWLEKGLSTFEFSIAVPSSSPTYDRSPLGKITYVASAHVKAPGAGILKKRAFDLVDRVDFCIVTSPPQGEGEGSPLQLDVQMDRWSDHFGLASLTMHSNAFIVASPLAITLKLTSPPKSLTIYAILVSLQQTTSLRSRRKPGMVETVLGPKRAVASQGPKAGWGREGFASRTRKSAAASGADGGLVFDGRAWAESEECRTGQSWEWHRIGRLPDDNEIRGNTSLGTETDLRFSSDLCVEVVFTTSSSSVVGDGTEVVEEGPVQISRLYKQPTLLASCCCRPMSLDLPSYVDDASAPNLDPSMRHWSQRPDVCMCKTSWNVLERAAQESAERREILEVVRRADEALHLSGGGAGGAAGSRDPEGSGSGAGAARKLGEKDWGRVV